jgi:hypothetical protein
MRAKSSENEIHMMSLEVMVACLEQKTSRIRSSLAVDHLQFDFLRLSLSLRCRRKWVEHCSLPIVASTSSTSEYLMRIDSSSIMIFVSPSTTI